MHACTLPGVLRCMYGTLRLLMVFWYPPLYAFASTSTSTTVCCLFIFFIYREWPELDMNGVVRQSLAWPSAVRRNPERSAGRRVRGPATALSLLVPLNNIHTHDTCITCDANNLSNVPTQKVNKKSH